MKTAGFAALATLLLCSAVTQAAESESESILVTPVYSSTLSRMAAMSARNNPPTLNNLSRTSESAQKAPKAKPVICSRQPTRINTPIQVNTGSYSPEQFAQTRRCVGVGYYLSF